MDADVHERAEIRDVRDDAGERHAGAQIFQFMHGVGEGERLELRARVASRLIEFRQNVFQRGQADIVADIFFDVDLFAFRRVAHQLLHGAAEIARHALDEFVAFGMDGAGVERIVAVMNPQKARRLFEGFRAETGNFHQVFALAERPVFFAIFDDVFRELRAEAGNIGQELGAGGVRLHADRVDAAHHHVVEALFERGLIHVMLILADADGFRVYFDEFGERVLQAAANRNRAAHSHIVIREFVPRHFAGGIDGRAAFIHHHDRRVEVQFPQERLGFAARRAVADRDRFDLEFLAEFVHRRGGLFFLAFA